MKTIRTLWCENSIRHAPRKQAIYRIYHKDLYGKNNHWYLAYIGSTKNLRKRIFEHISHSKKFGITQWNAMILAIPMVNERKCKVTYELCSDISIEEMRNREFSLISLEKPRLNKQHNPARTYASGW